MRAIMLKYARHEHNVFPGRRQTILASRRCNAGTGKAVSSRSGCFCAEHGAELLVLNNEQLSPEQEMVEPRTAALPALYWTADCTKSGVSFSTRPRCAAGAS
jgi:hypothetical protein